MCQYRFVSPEFRAVPSAGCHCRLVQQCRVPGATAGLSSSAGWVQDCESYGTRPGPNAPKLRFDKGSSQHCWTSRQWHPAMTEPRASIARRTTSVECLLNCERANAHKSTSPNVPRRGADFQAKNWPGKAESRKQKAGRRGTARRSGRVPARTETGDM